MSENKIFDDYTPVDCNDCSHYWDDSCSGVVKGSSKRCTAFLATKRVDIPLQIKALQSTLKWLTVGIVAESIWIVIMLLMLVGG